jgi:hypothetical protein
VFFFKAGKYAGYSIICTLWNGSLTWEKWSFTISCVGSFLNDLYSVWHEGKSVQTWPVHSTMIVQVTTRFHLFLIGNRRIILNISNINSNLMKYMFQYTDQNVMAVFERMLLNRLKQILEVTFVIFRLLKCSVGPHGRRCYIFSRTSLAYCWKYTSEAAYFLCAYK